MVLVVVGGVLQILGLVCAAVGLGQVWAENPHPERLGWRIFGPAIRWVNIKVLRRRPAMHFGAASGSFTFTGSASGFVTKSLNANGSQEDWIRQVKAEVDAADLRAHQAHTLAERADKRVTDLEARLSAEVARVQAEVETTRKAEAADAVPLATIGLAVTAVGTVVGLVGSVLTG